jgi:histidine ammonia-lyase
MGANAATKLRKVLLNVQRVLAIELLTAAQALELRRPAMSSPALESIYNQLRAVAPFMERDEVLHYRLMAAERMLDNHPPAIK